MEPLARSYRYQVRDAANLPGNTLNVPFRTIPCKWASAVIFRWKSTDASDTLGGVSFEVFNEYVAAPTVTQVTTAQGYLTRGVPITVRLDKGDGFNSMILPQDVNGVFMHEFIRCFVNTVTGGVTPTNDISGFEITAEVLYKDGFDQLAGQTLTAL